MGPSSPKKGTQQPPLCGPCLLWPNGWMDQDATWYGGRPRPRPHCARWGLSSPTKRGTAAPTFGPRLLSPNGRSSQQLLSSCCTAHPFHRIPRNPILCNGLDTPLKALLPVRASAPRSNTWYLGSIRHSNPNGISIGSASTYVVLRCGLKLLRDYISVTNAGIYIPISKLWKTCHKGILLRVTRITGSWRLRRYINLLTYLLTKR